MEAPEFPRELDSLRSATEGICEEIDLEIYQSFNQSYSPSDWTRNPSSNETMFTFGVDGVGGQALIWRRDSQRSLLDCPVAFLGRDGEITVVAANFYRFGELLALGVSPYSVASESVPESAEKFPVIAEWMKENFPGYSAAGSVSLIIEEAKRILPEFKALVALHKGG